MATFKWHMRHLPYELLRDSADFLNRLESELKIDENPDVQLRRLYRMVFEAKNSWCLQVIASLKTLILTYERDGESIFDIRLSTIFFLLDHWKMIAACHEAYVSIGYLRLQNLHRMLSSEIGSEEHELEQGYLGAESNDE